jgi:hypothetical protein
MWDAVAFQLAVLKESIARKVLTEADAALEVPLLFDASTR